MLNESYASLNLVEGKSFCKQPLVIGRGVSYHIKEPKRQSFFKALSHTPKQNVRIYHMCMITSLLDPEAAILRAAAEDRGMFVTVFVSMTTPVTLFANQRLCQANTTE